MSMKNSGTRDQQVAVKIRRDIHYTFKRMCLDMPNRFISDEISDRLEQSLRRDGIPILNAPDFKS